MYFYIWFFFIYAFLGWCTEVIYAAFDDRKLVNRGFLHGPVCPIYGIGVCIIIVTLTPVKGNIILSFVAAVILISALELITGWLLEKMFNQKWWDYSHRSFNIKGYICLSFSLMWGIACLMIIDIIHPIVYDTINLVPVSIGKLLLVVFSVVMIVDIILTIKSVIKLNKVLEQVNEIAEKIRSFSEGIATESISFIEKSGELKNILIEGKSITGKFVEEQMDKVDQSFEKAKEQILELEQKRKELISKGLIEGKRLLKAFPKIRSKNYKEIMEELKEKL